MTDSKKGFSGIGDLISDVQIIDISPAEKSTPSEPKKNSENDSQTQPQKKSKAGLWWILGIIFVIWAASQGNSDKHISSNSPTYNSNSNYDSNAEEKPMVGSNLVHSRAEIRYCLSEEVRLNAIENNISKENDVEITGYNAAIADYNSRCATYRYRPGDLESVRNQVDANRPKLVSEGLNRLKSWQPIAPTINTNTVVSPPQNTPDTASSQTDTSNLNFETSITEPDIYVGKFSYVAKDKSSAGVVEISKLPSRETAKNLYKISAQVATKSGCTGEVQGVGTPMKDVMAFALGDGKKCYFGVKLDPSENILNIDEGKECNYYHGANCGFSGQYQRQQESVAPNNDAAMSNATRPEAPESAESKDIDTLPDPVLVNAINEFVGKLPMKMDGVTLENVKAEGKVILVYMYRITGDAKSFNASAAAPTIFEHWCKSIEGAPFRKIDAVILYRYFDMQGAPVEEIKAPTKACK